MRRIHLISGATSGIGRSIYTKLRSIGDECIPIVRVQEQAQELEAERFVLFDFKQPDTVERCFTQLNAPLDSFINCAAVNLGKSVFESSPQDLMGLMAVNVVSPMLICASIRRLMKMGSAAILFSSQSAYKGGYDDAYNASKGAINSFIKSLAVKFAPDVRVIGIAPGITLGTRMTQSRRENDLERLCGGIPLRRFADPSELAELVKLVLGPAGAYMTGSVIDVNGGNYLR